MLYVLVVICHVWPKSLLLCHVTLHSIQTCVNKQDLKGIQNSSYQLLSYNNKPGFANPNTLK